MVQYVPVNFVKVTLHSMYVYGRKTLCYGGLPMLLHRSRGHEQQSFARSQLLLDHTQVVLSPVKDPGGLLPGIIYISGFDTMYKLLSHTERRHFE